MLKCVPDTASCIVSYYMIGTTVYMAGWAVGTTVYSTVYYRRMACQYLCNLILRKTLRNVVVQIVTATASQLAS